MLKKGETVKWESEAIKSFQNIKEAIKMAPVLKSPNFSKPLQLFSFASFHIVATCLLQKNEEGFEQPSAFFNM